MEKYIKSFKSSCLYNLAQKLQSYNNVYIYGAGAIGKFMMEYLVANGAADKVKNVVVTQFDEGGGGFS